MASTQGSLYGSANTSTAYRNKMEPVIRKLIVHCLKPNDNSRGMNSLNDAFLERVLVSFPYTDEQLAKFFVFACPTTYTGINANVFSYYFKQAMINQNVERLNNIIVDPERYYLEFKDNQMLSEEEKAVIRQMELEELIMMLGNFTGGGNDQASMACLRSIPFFSNLFVMDDQVSIRIMSDPANKHIVIIEESTGDGQTRQVNMPPVDENFSLQARPGQNPNVGQYVKGKTIKSSISFSDLIHLLATSGINPATGEAFRLPVLNVLRAKFLKEVKMYQRFMVFKTQQEKKDSIGKISTKP
jgi:hypothetical protein